MAAILITSIQHYCGTNAERVAMSTTGLKTGSEFYATDTEKHWIWDGSAWAQGIFYGPLEA